MCRCKNSRGVALLLSLVLVMFLAVLMLASLLRQQAQIAHVASRLASQQAFSCAETGVQVAVANLRALSTWGQPASTAGAYVIGKTAIKDTAGNIAGFYRVWVYAPSTAPTFRGMPFLWVRSDGWDSDPDTNPDAHERSVIAAVMLINPAQFFISTAGNLRLASGSVINESLMAGNLIFSPTVGNIRVKGQAYYLNSVSGVDAQVVLDVGPPKQLPGVAFIGVDNARYLAAAQQPGGIYVSGDMSYDDSNMPSPANGIVYVDGNITIKGTVNQNILFVSSRNIYIKGDLKTSLDATTGRNFQVGLFSSNDVIVPAGTNAGSDLTINAFVLADGQGTVPGAKGVFSVEPPPRATGAIHFNGSIAARAANAAITALDLNAFPVRDYLLDTNMKDNNTIPQFPTMVSVLHWQDDDPANPPPSAAYTPAWH